MDRCRAATVRISGVAILLLLPALPLVALSCLHSPPEAYSPGLPFLTQDGATPVRAVTSGLFPERTLLAPCEETPPQALARVDAVLRQVAILRSPEPEDQRGILRQEIDTIQADLDRLRLGLGQLWRFKLGYPRQAERILQRRAASLYLRWGLAEMRSGEVNERTWGAQKLRQAEVWDPGNPIVTLVLAGYLNLAGYRSNELVVLDAYDREWGPTDVIDLRRLRSREANWKVTHFPDELDQALGLCAGMASRNGGWDKCPAWLLFERARLCLLADSTRAAERAAAQALARAGAGSDSLTAAQAELLLGVCQVRRLEYKTGAAHLQRALDLAGRLAPLQPLASGLLVPWAMWTAEQRSEFDRATDRLDLVERFWRVTDPILATPELLENRIEYDRRVGEAWFLLSGVDPRTAPTLTEPGEAILRFGLPAMWLAQEGIGTPGRPVPVGFRFSNGQRWIYEYSFRAGRDKRSARITFLNDGVSGRYTSTDSLRGATWPPFVFSEDFGGRWYRFNASMARFRGMGGRPLLTLSYDTFAPDYSVRFPMQGVQFDGDARVRATLYYLSHGERRVGAEVELGLSREFTLPGTRILRRRAGSVRLDGLEADSVRLASLLTLRNGAGQITALSADNGEEIDLPIYGQGHLDASDLLLTSIPPDSQPKEREWSDEPGVVIYGPDPTTAALAPRADRLFLPGENLTFYFEVYNLAQLRGAAEAELFLSLQHLGENDQVDYTVTTSGEVQSLSRPQVTQWNVLRSMRLDGMPPGRYRLQIGVLDHNSGQDVVRSLPLEIVEPARIVELYDWERLKLPFPS